MPATKPNSLNKRHDTKSDRDARKDAESALIPKTALPIYPPAALDGHEQARAIWIQLVGLYFETKGTIVTAFDQQVLIEYCKIIEEELNLEKKVRDLDQAQNDGLKNAKKIKPTAKNLKDWVAMWGQVNAMTKNFKEMDARLDGKRKLKLALEQSLYLTPRSRAGVAPPEKDPEEPQSDMDKMLDGKKN